MHGGCIVKNAKMNCIPPPNLRWEMLTKSEQVTQNVTETIKTAPTPVKIRKFDGLVRNMIIIFVAPFLYFVVNQKKKQILYMHSDEINEEPHYCYQFL